LALHSEFQKIPISLPEINAGECAEISTELKSKFDAEYADHTVILKFLSAAFSLSPYLKSCGFKEVPFLLEVISSGFEQASNNILADTDQLGLAGQGDDAFMSVIRKQKRRMALLCGLADLGGCWSCERVTNTLSIFAEKSLRACFNQLLLSEHKKGKLTLPNPNDPQQESGLILLGMGKLGAGELNYSSDIDLILLFDPSAGIELQSDDATTYWMRLARRLIQFMQERTADGYVFRMDLRLRPDPSATPLAIPVEAALSYYETQGQNWERAAMIKAKPVAGDMVASAQFMNEIAPFIWRKYLDFAAIDDIRSIKRQIHAYKGHSHISVLCHNIKLGRGGIREIEFFAQTQQLIAGGRNPELRTNKTIEALGLLAEKGWIKNETSEELKQAYWFLRKLEHRLQMISDQQTHTLPETDKELVIVAAMFGECDVKSFKQRIELNLKTVEAHYAVLFESSDDLGSETGNLVFTGDADDPNTVQTLETLGYKEPGEVIKIVKSWHAARMPATRNEKARELLTELMPSLLQAFGRAGEPDAALSKFDRFLNGLPAGIQFFSILKSNPNIGALLVSILDSAPRLADMIARKPHVFDAFLEPHFEATLQDKAKLRDILMPVLAQATNYEIALDDARRFFQQSQFLIGAHIFTGLLSPINARACFTILAEVMIEVMLNVTHTEFAKRHGVVPNTEICILAMGRLGSEELSATSDLDLIFLYRDNEDQYSDGEKQLASSQYYIRLIQRFITSMSSPTAEGVIFELDFRLRPSGNSGPIATHVNHFVKYQSEEAWVWEAQALTRARPVAGDQSLCGEVSALRSELIEKAIAGKDFKKEIRNMRFAIEKEKGTADVWDVKNTTGGLIDIEFIAQYIVLKNGAKDTMNTRDVFTAYPSSLESGIVDELQMAYDLFTNFNILQGICIGKTTDIQAAPEGFHTLICSQFDLPDLATLEAHLKQTQTRVREIFNLILK